MQYLIYIIYILLLAMNIGCLLVHKPNRYIQVLTFVFLIILMGGNTFNNDYIGYENFYNGINDSHFASEYGLKFVFYLGNLVRLPYQGMLFLILSGALLWNFRVAQKENADIHLVLAMYLTFGFIADTVVVRNFIAITFLTSALICLSKGKRKKSLLFMIMAVLFHKTMLFYFPLLFVNFNRASNRKLAKWGAVSIVVFCFIVFAFGGRFEKIAQIISNIIYGGEGSIYLDGGVNYGFLIYFFVQIISLFTIFYARKMLLKNEQRSTPGVMAMLNTAYIVNCYVVLCFPLLMISVAMHRLFRNVMFFNLICLGATLNTFEYKKVSSRYYMFCAILLGFALAWRILYLFEMPVEFGQIMHNNILF